MKSFLILIFSITFLVARSQNDTVLIENLRYGWIQIIEDEVRPVSDPSTTSLLVFSVVDTEGDLLKICNDEPVDIWVNLKMVQNNISRCFIINLDSLKRALQSDSLVFQVAATDGMSNLSTEIFKLEAGNKSILLFANRGNISFNNFYLIGFVFLLLLFALLRRKFPERFNRIFLNPFKIRGSTLDDYYTDFLRPDSIFFILCFAGLAAFNLKYLDFSNYANSFESTSFWEFLSDWGVKILYIISFVLIKYFVGHFFSNLFQFKSIGNIHNQDFLYLMTWVLIAVFFISVLDFSLTLFTGLFISWFTLYFVIGVILVFQLGIYMKLDKILSGNKMLIISYLCATEFLPGFILVYMLLK
ncbi:MAG: hypothetical protein ACJA08_001343 [Cyclobacteriaceae bacterium]|jgi:hypothetical protein